MTTSCAICTRLPAPPENQEGTAVIDPTITVKRRAARSALFFVETSPGASSTLDVPASKCFVALGNSENRCGGLEKRWLGHQKKNRERRAGAYVLIFRDASH